MKKKYVASSTFDGYRKLVTLRADSMTIRPPIPPTSGHSFHKHPDTDSTAIRTLSGRQKRRTIDFLD
ncbi:hypothetical protein IMW75_18200 [Pseudomonas gregormendelii]|uniref:Uncharacterized protein n=1 Tax=Pseudomonas gregormendelii TaxID=1628277 RepID=A0ABS3AJL6_9PSED|nr:hypothetical protein [Pseudomonas gregormendelii]MBN3967200.1 hypothetical protein [Pseudomonas gregormendelii]